MDKYLSTSIAKADGWYVLKNAFSRSLMNFYVAIYIINKDNELSFRLEVDNSDTEIKTISFMFSTLEEAFRFTEDVVRKCWTFEEIAQTYNEIYGIKYSKVLKKGDIYGSKK